MNKQQVVNRVNEWASWIEKHNDDGWQGQTVLGRLIEEGPAAGRQPAHSVALIGFPMPHPIKRTDVAIEGLKGYRPEQHAVLVCAHRSTEKKPMILFCRENNISQPTYYKRLENAYTWIASALVNGST